MRKVSVTGALLLVVAMLGGLKAQTVLIQKADLQYEGAFRVPATDSGSSRFDGGGSALTFNPVNNSLLAVGHVTDQHVAEITIPAPSKATSYASLPTATFRQAFKDILEGKRESIVSADTSGKYIGGMLVSGSTLLATAYGYYDASGAQVNSHFKTGTNFATTGDVVGPVRVGTRGAGFVGGYMAPLPAEWQAAFGGNAVTGLCCIPIQSRTSAGPALSVFNVADVGTKNPVPASELVGYPLGQEPGANVFVPSSEVKGVVIPRGTRTALFIGRHGLGSTCYGDGSACGDPAYPYKGYHNYPYVYQVWAYDLNDLLAVKNGQKSATSIRPYAMWTLDLPFGVSSKAVKGATFDPATMRIFIATESNGGYSRPVVHVFKVNTGTSTTPPPPAAPANIRILS